MLNEALGNWKEFSYNRILSSHNRIGLWGAGDRGEMILREIKSRGAGELIVGFIDSDMAKCNRKLNSKAIYSPDKIQGLNLDAIIVTSYFESEIVDYLSKISFPPHLIFRSFEIEPFGAKKLENVQWSPGLRWKSSKNPGAAASNFIRFLANFSKRTAFVENYPFYLNIEPSQMCNLSCPVCLIKMGRPQKGEVMDLDYFKGIIDSMGPYLYYLHLYRKGESFTNKKFLQMLRYANENSSALIYISSNFSFPFKDDDLVSILKSADYVGVCLDGMSPETYNKYRVGGNFNTVLKNLLRLRELHNDLKPNCMLSWRFIVFRHNEHEVSEAEEFARQHGIEIELVKAFVPDRSWLPESKKYWRSIYLAPGVDSDINTTNTTDQFPCTWPYGSAGIGSDGEIYPCCEFEAQWGNFGRFSPDKAHELFNCSDYQIARGGISGGESGNGLYCLKCPPSIRQTTNDFELHSKNIQDFIVRNPQLLSDDRSQSIDMGALEVISPTLLRSDFKELLHFSQIGIA